MDVVQVPSVDGIPLDAVVHSATGYEPVGTVVQVHGITVDLDEGGMFTRLADRLAGAGLSAVRFSFRGHGRSGGTQRGVTVAGEMLDLEAVIDYTVRNLPGPFSIVAASFGAVATTLSLPYLANRLHGLVLWNPVLDLRHTFVEPVLSWGVENFSPSQQQRLHRDGYLLVDGEFELGRVLFEEFKTYEPTDAFLAGGVPSLVVHGDRDSYVSYDVAKAAATAHPRCEFHTVLGSGHGFDTRAREDEAIAVTGDWLTRRHSTAA